MKALRNHRSVRLTGSAATGPSQTLPPPAVRRRPEIRPAHPSARGLADVNCTVQLPSQRCHDVNCSVQLATPRPGHANCSVQLPTPGLGHVNCTVQLPTTRLGHANCRVQLTSWRHPPANITTLYEKCYVEFWSQIQRQKFAMGQPLLLLIRRRGRRLYPAGSTPTNSANK